MLDPKYALEEVEEEKGGSSDKITSLKKLLTTKRNRSGYDEEDKNQTMWAECDLMEFIKASDPHLYLSGFNKFTISEETRAETLKHAKFPKDLEIFICDLKTCGRKEYSDLLKFRLKYVHAIEAINKEANDKKR